MFRFSEIFFKINSLNQLLKKLSISRMYLGAEEDSGGILFLIRLSFFPHPKKSPHARAERNERIHFTESFFFFFETL
jgi:hypothetical protein